MAALTSGGAVCIGRKGAIARRGPSLESEVAFEIPPGAVVRTLGDGAAAESDVARLRIAYGPRRGWVSRRLFMSLPPNDAPQMQPTAIARRLLATAPPRRSIAATMKLLDAAHQRGAGSLMLSTPRPLPKPDLDTLRTLP